MSISIASASGSSRSAGPWTCRRPRTTSRATAQRSERAVEDERLLGVIRVTHKQNYEAYGYRRMWKALGRAGETAPRCQVQRLMAANGIQGAKRRGKPWRTTTPDPDATRPRDLVNRDFTAQAPNRLWVRRFHVSALLGGRRLLQLRDRRVLAGWSSAGSSPVTCAPTWCSTRCGWRSGSESPALTSSSWPIRMPAANTRVSTTRRCSTITRCSRRSDRSETPTTTRLPNLSLIPTRPS